MRSDAMKVGELARRSGLTVRTLHHYDEIGLLRPSLHTGSGHRLYTAGDVARLQQILSLRQLGFSLDEVRGCLTRADFSPLEVIRLHVARLREQIALQRELCGRLEALAGTLGAAGEVSAETFLQAIEVMKMIEQYYTPEQLEQLKKRAEATGEERMKAVGGEWAEVYAAFRREMEAGTDPANAKVQAIQKRAQGLIDEFTGGDAGILASVTKLWQEQGDKIKSQYGYDTDPKLAEYMDRARKASAQ